MNKISIIGAGISGLTCGIYAQLNGFETEIYEAHTIPGGECTGWDRGGYHFDGCLHWLTGSKPDTDLYDLWRTTGALSDDVIIHNHEIFARYEEGERYVNLYTDADKLEKHLLELSPEDKREIKRLCRDIRKIGTMSAPMSKPMDLMSPWELLSYMSKNMGAFLAMSKYSKLSLIDYCKRFKSPLIGRALVSSVPGDYQAYVPIITLGGMNQGDLGFPVGGSRAMAKRMEQRYLSLGGKVHYKSRVKTVLIENNAAVGLRLENGAETRSDYVISCADAHATFYKMLEDRYTPEVYRNLFENPTGRYLPTCAMVYMGINCELPDTYRQLKFPRQLPARLCGRTYDDVEFLCYNFDYTLMPKGKSIVASYYLANYDDWRLLNKEQYAAYKEQLRQDAVAALLERYPQTDGKIETIDVVTPMTYVRYCDAWRGAWMTWPQGKGVPQYFPGKLEGLDGFLLASMWAMPPGGLPSAAAAGRFAAHRLTLAEGREFVTA